MKTVRIAAAIALLMGTSAVTVLRAASFTAGNVVVYRVGDGTAFASDAAAPVFADEYSPAGALVQSIALPTTAVGNQKSLTARFAGGEIGEGLLTLSADGRFLMLPGYAAAVGSASPHASTAERVVARIDGAGAVDASTGLGGIYSGEQIVSAASTDGTSIWVSGGGGSDINTGVNYTTFGSGTWTNVIGENPTGRHNTRGIGIWGGQLFAATNKDNAPLPVVTDVYQVGVGTPTTGQAAVQTMANVPRAGGSPMAMALFDLDVQIPGLDALYYTDNGGSALSKFSKLVDGSWTSNGQIGSGGEDWTGLTAAVEGDGVRLYATRDINDVDELVTLLDISGYNGSLAGTTVNALAMAGANTFFRGVAFAPTAIPEPSSFALVTLSVASVCFIRRRRA